MTFQGTSAADQYLHSQQSGITFSYYSHISLFIIINYISYIYINTATTSDILLDIVLLDEVLQRNDRQYIPLFNSLEMSCAF